MLFRSDGVHIFFPDPWHKTRHYKRRLIQKDFVFVFDLVFVFVLVVFVGLMWSGK